MIGDQLWRVTLKSIHPWEVRVIPRKWVKKLEALIRDSLATGIIDKYILDKRIMKTMSEEMLGQATQ